MSDSKVELSDIQIQGFTLMGRASKGGSYSVFEMNLVEAFVDGIDDCIEITEAHNPYWDEGPGFVTPDDIYGAIEDRFGKRYEDTLKRAYAELESILSTESQDAKAKTDAIDFCPYSELSERERSIVDSRDVDDEPYREAAAKLGLGLDKLIEDPAASVRAEVGRQGFGLDTLIHDKAYEVREVVAHRGFGLDQLINDSNPYVRAAVARQGYGLEHLVNDSVPLVLMGVADQGYGLDKFISSNVRYAAPRAERYLEKAGLTLDEWIEQNPDKCALPENKIKACRISLREEGNAMKKAAEKLNSEAVVPARSLDVRGPDDR